jgi:CheY-like chemotaxis protein
MGQAEADLVRDNPDDLELVLRELRRGGLADHDEVVRDGDQPLNLCRGMHARRRGIAQPSRLEPVDLKLFKMDGLQVLEQPKNYRTNEQIHVVIPTASKEERGLTKSDQWGIPGSMQEQVDFEQAREAIKRSSLFWLAMNQPPPRIAFQGG